MFTNPTIATKPPSATTKLTHLSPSIHPSLRLSIRLSHPSIYIDTRPLTQPTCTCVSFFNFSPALHLLHQHLPLCVRPSVCLPVCLHNLLHPYPGLRFKSHLLCIALRNSSGISCERFSKCKSLHSIQPPINQPTNQRLNQPTNQRLSTQPTNSNYRAQQKFTLHSPRSLQQTELTISLAALYQLTDLNASIHV